MPHYLGRLTSRRYERDRESFDKAYSSVPAPAPSTVQNTNLNEGSSGFELHKIIAVVFIFVTALLFSKAKITGYTSLDAGGIGSYSFLGTLLLLVAIVLLLHKK